MSFSAASFQAYLTQNKQINLPLHIFSCITSTNQQLWQILAKNQQTPTVAIALQQTQGRGQWGRVWQSRLGGLYLSLALSPNLAIRSSIHLTLATAWGISQVLQKRDIPLKIKWPNDLVLQGKKLGGIKLETRTKHTNIKTAIIGVGINWTNPTPSTGINLKSYYQSYSSVEPISNLEELAALTVTGIISGYEYYQAVGINRLLSSYLEKLDNLGQIINFNGNVGRITGVNEQGQLKVKLFSQAGKSEITFEPGQISLGYNI